MFQRIISSAMSFRSIAVVFTTSLALLGSSLSAQDLDRGKTLFQNCVACHGPDAHGNQLLNAPALAGLSAVYIEAQVHNFKHSIRGADARDQTGLLMRPMSKILQDEQPIKDVSAYIATLTAKPPVDTLEGGDATKGQASYMLCLACHGPDAGGNELLKSPSLKYQNDWYMLAQLKKFKEGVRGTNPKDVGGMQMRPMSMTLVDEQAMKDVIAHIRSISPQE
jgi:cytochrome c553